ncbi:addiction module protein [Clostridia bacterium]|nr:addiction module protein [Clostridia bacterium]
MYKLEFSKQAVKDGKRIQETGLMPKIQVLLDILRENPYQNPPPYEKLKGYENEYSRRINVQHRLVYKIDGDIIRLSRMWTHYE